MNKKNSVMMGSMLLVLLPSIEVAAKGFIDDLDKSVGITTNYVWRGVSQGPGLPAVQGGATYEMKNGLSVDLWLSSSAALGTSDEYDLTVSYAEQKRKSGYEFGVVSYSYPKVVGAGFQEIFGGIKMNEMNAYVYINPDSAMGNNIYIDLSVDIDDINLSLGVNSNDGTVAANPKYNQLTAKVMLTEELALSLSQTDIDGAKQEMSLSYSIPLK